MSKLKAITIFAVAIIFVAMGVSIQILSKNLKQERADKKRLWHNNMELSSSNWQYQKLIYTRDEFIKVQDAKLKQALDSLKIKPKSVEKIVYRTITEKDTVVREIPVLQIANKQWQFVDTGACYIYKGVISYIDDSIHVKKTDFSYDNGTQQFFYGQRPHKFLFFKWGKREVNQITVPKCGTVSERVIEIQSCIKKIKVVK